MIKYRSLRDVNLYYDGAWSRSVTLRDDAPRHIMADVGAASAASTAIRRHWVKRRTIDRNILGFYLKVRQATKRAKKLAKKAKLADIRVKDATKRADNACLALEGDENTYEEAALRSTGADILAKRAVATAGYYYKKYHESRVSANKLEDAATETKEEETICRGVCVASKKFAELQLSDVQEAIKESLAAVAAAYKASEEADAAIREMAKNAE